ncbi:hypothetical protein [Burkholderia sp. Ac-20365]|jgi:hypothetical protein|uniref:hypothetical protein n=1 Tax=Burkholderia sp. Ac-20365 TaxID=2703897 RepID=UPI00197B8E78|nr:hypothetical protein [Burkholderia sp. Ac-20365]MBN3765581.1 hypothetical protein [Burkholderia sp. Ac-20365]
MFERFASTFVRDDRAAQVGGEVPVDLRDHQPIEQLRLQFGGVSFNDGLYRIVDAGSGVIGIA